MTWLADHTLHLVLITIYLSVLGYHASLGRRHTKSVDDYLVAGRRMGGFVIALSFYATFMSTNTFIGAAGKSWDLGLAWCTGGVVLTALACASWLVVAPRFVPLTREYQSLTVADFLGSHYNSPAVRRIAASIVAFASVLYLVAIYRGAALALEFFLGLPYGGCVLAVFFIVTTYTLLGGFESVVLTDALQGLIMLIGAVALLVAMISAGGGLPQILETLHQQNPRLTSLSDPTALSAAMAYSLAVGIKYLVEPRQLSRFYGLRDARALRLASVIAPLAILVSYSCLLPIGALARTIVAPEAISATDQVVPHLLGSSNLLGSFAGTLFLLVLVSAAMSSIDSVLLVAASTIDRDLIARAIPEQTIKSDTLESVKRIRIWVVLISLASAGAVILPFTRDIVQMTKFSGSLYGACFLPVLVVGLFVGQRSASAAVMTMIAGSICVVATFVLRELGLTTMEEVYPGMATGMVVYIVLSLVLKRRSP